MVNKVILQKEATLTERFQTTIPKEIRTALSLGKGDKITFELNSDNTVSLIKNTHTDPALTSFLNLLERDIIEHPEKLTITTQSEKEEIDSLLDGLNVNLDEGFLD
ncbi:Antitoxin PrlF [Vibrio chagasii]|nr:Antitoxin PrlF [Vibrio chagasii]